MSVFNDCLCALLSTLGRPYTCRVGTFFGMRITISPCFALRLWHSGPVDHERPIESLCTRSVFNINGAGLPDSLPAARSTLSGELS
jgi:hypothetical protein